MKGIIFLNPKTRVTFNNLLLVFIKTSIFSYFNSEYHIYVKNDILGYVISNLLSKLTFRYSLNEVVIKTDLG